MNNDSFINIGAKVLIKIEYASDFHGSIDHNNVVGQIYLNLLHIVYIVEMGR